MLPPRPRADKGRRSDAGPLAPWGAANCMPADGWVSPGIQRRGLSQEYDEHPTACRWRRKNSSVREEKPFLNARRARSPCGCRFAEGGAQTTTPRPKAGASKVRSPVRRSHRLVIYARSSLATPSHKRQDADPQRGEGHRRGLGDQGPNSRGVLIGVVADETTIFGTREIERKGSCVAAEWRG